MGKDEEDAPEVEVVVQEEPPMMTSSPEEKPFSEKPVRRPFDEATAFSRFTYLYALPLFRLGATRPLQESDLPALAMRDEVWKVAGRIDDERRKSPKSHLTWVLLRAFRKELVLSGWYFFVDFAAIIAQAAVLRPFVNWLASSKTSFREGALWALSIAALGVLNGVYHHYAFFVLMRTGWNLRLGMQRVLHDKLLKIRGADLAARTSHGKVYAIVATDAQRFDNLLPFFHAPWFSALAIPAVWALMALIVGPLAAAAGCGVVVLSVFVQVKLAFQFRRLRARTAARTDVRVRVVSETCAGIATVKATGWTEGFLHKIDAERQKETRTILRSQYCKAITSGLYFCTVVVATFAVYAVLFLGDAGPATLKVGDVASVISLLNALRQVVSFGTAYFSMSAPEVLVALRRMQTFLDLPEVPVRSGTSRPAREPRSKNDSSSSQQLALLAARDADLAWPCASNLKNDETLQKQRGVERTVVVSNINVEVPPRTTVAVTGPIAAGKTAFLQACLGELDVVKGSLEIHARRLCYAAQEPWLFAGTLRENVLAAARGGTRSSDVEEEAFYDTVLDLCDLGIDVASLPGGKDCWLGDRGVTLSGGQRARVGLARAVAAALFDSNDSNDDLEDDAPLVLLDDVTSALDPKVARRVVDRVLDALLRRGCGVVFATHDAAAVERTADVVLELDATGKAATLTMTKKETSNAVLEDYDDDVEEEDDNGRDTTVSPSTLLRKTSVRALLLPREKSQSPSQSHRVLKEQRETGAVKLRTWLAYARGAGWVAVSFVTVLFLVGQGLLIASDAYLLSWASIEGRKAQRRPRHVVIFGLLATATVFVSLARAAAFFACAMRAANALHRDAVAGVFRAPLWFHAATPRGRIVNRFSSDVGNVDELLAQALFDLFQLGLLMLAVVVAAIVAAPLLAALVPFLLYGFVSVKRFTSKSMNELKRLDQTTRSPAIARFADTLHGLVSIRAFNNGALCDAARRELDHCLDVNARAWFWWLLSQRLLGFSLDAMCLLFLTTLAFLLVVLKTTTALNARPELAALALLYAVQLASNFQWCVRQYALAESFMASVERLLDYGHALPTEIERSSRATKPTVPSKDWPQTSRVAVRDLRVRYREDLPDVLSGVTCSFASGSTVGVCGRTGSGKSSFALALGRLNVISGGAIYLDGMDLAGISLQHLRQLVAVIPQDPHLFAGTVATNVDPLDEHGRRAVRDALRGVGFLHSSSSSSELKKADADDNIDDDDNEVLDRPVLERADNLSAGEAQLICLARALLLDRKVLSLDESTASTDDATDAKVQRHLRDIKSKRHGCTVFIIAHRISTILDADAVLVLKDGHLLEHGPPDVLLANPDGAFRALKDAATRGTASHSS